MPSELDETSESFLVRPNIGLLNRYAQKAKQISITSINPVFSPSDEMSTQKNLMGLRIQVEGSPRSLRYFHRLLQGADLTV